MVVPGFFFEFLIFFLSRKPAPWWSIAGSLMVVPGFFFIFVAYGQSGWLYDEVFAFFCVGLAFCLSVFELSSFGFIFLPFCGCLSLCEVVGGDFEACFVAVCCPLFR